MAAPLLVTPEAVLLDLDTAGVPTRLLARMLDLALQATVLVLGLLALGLLSGASESAALVFAFFFVPVVLLAYPVILETAWHGRTLGKAALGLRVVTREGTPTRLRHAAVRGAVGVLEVFLCFGAPGVITMFASRDGQRLGDLAAGTIVVRERSAAKAPTAMTFAVPYGYEAFAATVDTSRLTEPDLQAARTFVVRAATMDPSARAKVAASLATTLATRLGQPISDRVPPDVLLAVIVARRQQRSAPATPSAPQPPASVAPASASSSIWPGGAPTAPGPAAPDPAAPADDHGFSAPS